MKTKQVVGLGLASLCGAIVAQGAEAVAGLNRVSFNARFGFNTRATFRADTGSALANTDPLALGLNRIYDNGNVNGTVAPASPFTTTYAYDATALVNAVAPGSLTLSATTASPEDNFKGTSRDVQYGFEIGYGRELGRVGDGTAPWGLCAFFNYSPADYRNNATRTGNLTVRTDTFLSSVFPLPAGPQDFSAGTGPQISSTPTIPSTETTVPAVANLATKLEGDLYGFKFGPWIEFPLGDRIGVQFRGGVAVMEADLKLRWNESVTAVPGDLRARPGNFSRESDACLIGGFVGVQASCRIYENWALLIGGEYQTLGQHTISNSGRSAKLDLRDGIFLTAGLGVNF